MELDHTKYCCICKESLLFGDTIQVTRGFEKLKESSRERGDGLLEFLETLNSVKVHTACRSQYNHKHMIQSYINQKNKSTNEPSASTSSMRKNVRLSSTPFDWKTNCFICGKGLDFKNFKKQKRNPKFRICSVSSNSLRNTIVNLITERTDDYHRSIHERISETLDLVGVYAKYHQKCYHTLQHPHVEIKSPAGRPEDPETTASMDKIIDYIEESKDSHFFISELKDRLTADDYGPSEYVIINRLESYYGKAVIVQRKAGYPTIISFVSGHYELLAKALLNTDGLSEKEQQLLIMKTAVDIERAAKTTVCLDIIS